MQKLPLEGIRVLDFSRVLAGPWASMSLADLGAEVWKVEHIRGGDDTRAWSVPSHKGVSTYYLCANRGKQSLALDLKTPEGLAIARDLAAKADVIVENFRAGTMERLGLGYDALREINPGLIFCSISGYGQTGPERERPGYDFIMQAESGLMAVTGPEGGPPSRLGVAFTDVVAGMHATQGILAALYQRRDTGQGQHLDVALLDSTLNLLINLGTGYLNAGVEPGRYGNAHPSVVPYQLLDTADGQFALAVGNDRMFRDFCNKVIGRPDMATDPDYATAAARARNRPALLAQIGEVMLTQSSAHWLAACRAADVPAGPVKSVAEALSAPSVTERGVIRTLSHPHLGDLRVIGPAQGLAAQHEADRVVKAPPMLGEDSADLLQRVLGLSPERIEALARAGVVGIWQPPAGGAL
ncbi:CaiB/BaiF CoA transferase family protein [Falsigemmobacter faecalis]|uniref:CoA transferase n=1 Tax=Falsigemmobacter faecalis TaxID=2488730 RepID=A0A3P3DPE0_9RHOB|nr:CaiB/BaiF CoA-transferase family protein [Falsigemmobacter faecalis]RRH76123.1 CoA transferase [Falsigemmobacter faecalis]